VYAQCNQGLIILRGSGELEDYVVNCATFSWCSSENLGIFPLYEGVNKASFKTGLFVISLYFVKL
jgi:hypothetical protein